MTLSEFKQELIEARKEGDEVPIVLGTMNATEVIVRVGHAICTRLDNLLWELGRVQSDVNCIDNHHHNR